MKLFTTVAERCHYKEARRELIVINSPLIYVTIVYLAKEASCLSGLTAQLDLRSAL